MSEKVYGPAALKRAQVLVLSSRDEFVRCGRRAAGALIRLDVINVRNRFPPRTTVVLRACMWPHAAKPISQMRHPPGFEDGTREAHSSPRLRAGRRPVVRPDRAGGLPRREESLPRPRTTRMTTRHATRKTTTTTKATTTMAKTPRRRLLRRRKAMTRTTATKAARATPGTSLDRTLARTPGRETRAPRPSRCLRACPRGCGFS